MTRTSFQINIPVYKNLWRKLKPIMYLFRSCQVLVKLESRKLKRKYRRQMNKPLLQKKITHNNQGIQLKEMFSHNSHVLQVITMEQCLATTHMYCKSHNGTMFSPNSRVLQVKQWNNV